MKAYYSALLFLCIVFSQTTFAQRNATILDHKDRIRITRLDVLSSPYRETNLSITPDGQYIFFMSLRGGQPWSQSYTTYKGEPVYDGDIWYAQKGSGPGKWNRPKCLGPNINSPNGEDEPVVSPNGRTVYFQSWQNFWYLSGGPYYQSSMKDNRWGPPKGLGGGITSFFMSEDILATDGMTISPSGTTFIVACGKDYDDNMDLYISRKTFKGWGYCKKLPISTTGDERSVFLAADGRTIYFASDGYEGFGGLDIFKTTLKEDGSFGEVINVGKPFNTSGDDYGFILTGDGKEAYFIRNGDIYFADLTEADERIRPQLNILLAGTVIDTVKNKSVSAEIKIVDTNTRRAIAAGKSSGKQGKYSITLPNRSRTYKIVMEAKGYPEVSKFISVTESTDFNSYETNFRIGIPPEPEPDDPPIASVDPEDNNPPKDPITKPDKDPKDKPDKDPKDKDPKDKPDDVAVTNPPDKEPEKDPVIEEDPYSFEGVAENNLILLLDVSGSMNQPNKLPLLKQAFGNLLSYMRAEDQISVIIYSGDARVILDPTSAANKQKIMRSIEYLKTAGATKAKVGLKKAYQLAQDNYISGGNNRIILATDGSFDIESLYSIATKNASRVKLSVFAFGKQFKHKEEAMKSLADSGGGNYANVNSANIEKVLLQEAKAVRK